MEIPVKPNIKALRAALNAEGISLAKKLSTGEWRVNYLRGKEATAYYTTDFEDALATAKHFIKERKDGRL